MLIDFSITAEAYKITKNIILTYVEIKIYRIYESTNRILYVHARKIILILERGYQLLMLVCGKVEEEIIEQLHVDNLLRQIISVFLTFFSMPVFPMILLTFSTTICNFSTTTTFINFS